ncbi:MAG: hypothetical protein RLZZ574_2620 [Cyanobacteriota bacterium]|jgi:antitoxin VapB
MTINIKNSKADRLVQELGELTGENVTEIVIKSLAERLEREKSQKNTSMSVNREVEDAEETSTFPVKDELLAIAKRFQALPTLDNRSEEEILGYNDGY